MNTTDRLIDYISEVYSSEIIEDMAVVLCFLQDCKNGLQPVFLVQKEISLSVREQENIPSPYMN